MEDKIKYNEKQLNVAEHFMTTGHEQVNESSNLSSKEKNFADKMKKKGYNIVVQIETIKGDFGEPLYFKNANEVGPFLRSFPSYENAKIKWTEKI